MITIKLNGKNETLEDEINVANFLEQKSIKQQSVVVMINEDIIKKDKFETTLIKNGDKVEILRFVSGG